MEPFYSTDLYLKAFAQYCGASEANIKYKRIDRQLLVYYHNNYYYVAHKDDFREFFRHCFKEDKVSYDEIELYTCMPMWENLATELLDISPGEWITKLYREWDKYWSVQKRIIKGGDARYSRFRQEAFEKLTTLYAVIQVEPVNWFKSAELINDMEFRPLVALAIRSEYEDFDEFLDDVVDYYIAEGAALISWGDVFEHVPLDLSNDQVEHFYVYDTEASEDDVT
jgi:hypothetical protein